MNQTLQANKELVQRIYTEMWNQAEPAVADEIFASPEGVKKFVSEFLAALPDLEHTVHYMIAEGDRVAAVFKAWGTHIGTWRQYPATGKAIEYTGVTVARIASGKIAEHYTWWDRLGVYEQMKGD